MKKSTGRAEPQHRPASTRGGWRSGKHPIFDDVFWVATILVAVITAFSVVIAGIFATDSDSPTVMIAGLSVILAGPIILLLIVVTRLASRACTARGGKRLERTAICVTVIIYCVGAPAIMLGAWQCVRLLLPAASYQEANIESPYGPPAL